MLHVFFFVLLLYASLVSCGLVMKFASNDSVLLDVPQAFAPMFGKLVKTTDDIVNATAM
jgi:hypothetical protein